VVFVTSGVEDPERGPAKMSGFRGGRYISAEASARGEWQPGGSKLPGGDAYASSKQCNLAAVLSLARETPRLHFNAVEPGFSPATGLGRDANVFLRFLAKYVLGLLAPFIKYWSTLERAARVITKVLINGAGQTGVYYDEGGQPISAPRSCATRSSRTASSPRRGPCCRRFPYGTESLLAAYGQHPAGALHRPYRSRARYHVAIEELQDWAYTGKRLVPLKG
jgi:hypothetical protein